MADVAADLKSWSTTASSNTPTDNTTLGGGLADNLQEIQKVVRQDLAHKGADIASATTTDLGAVAGLMHDITGTTTITGFGTVSAGIWKIIKFEGALTLTHNATSLILPTGANITTADGDVAIVLSEGSGNWRCLHYQKATGFPMKGGQITLGTEQASTSGTEIDFTGIPSGVKRIVVNFLGVSTDGTSGILVQLGDSGGIENTTYTSVSIRADSTGSAEQTSTAGFAIAYPSASDVLRGSMVLELEDSSDFTWVSRHVCCHTGGAANRSVTGAGSKALSAELTQLRITTVSGDTFDAGAVNISYEF